MTASAVAPSGVGSRTWWTARACGGCWWSSPPQGRSPDPRRDWPRAQEERDAGKESEDDCIDRVLSREPDPKFAAEMAEECRRLLRKLADAELEAVALRRMEGYTVEEIAVQLGRAPRTEKRWLAMIRDIWQNEGLP